MRYPIFFIVCFLNVPIITEPAAWADPGDASSARAASAPSPSPVPGQSGASAASTQVTTGGATKVCQQRPWHCGVSQANQILAISLYRDGNMLFDDSLFHAAAAKYRAALEHWKHPGIYYNLMLCLVALDQPVDAYESSQGALQHGAVALGHEEYRRALDYRRLLRGRIAVLEVTSNEPGVVVSLNGKPLFQGPGTVRHLVLPGRHELVAKKPRYLTSHQTLTLFPAKPLHAHLAMLPEDQFTLSVRRWEGWQPWAMVGAGVGVGLLGGAFEWRAGVNNQSFETLFTKSCRPPQGCLESDYSDRMSMHERRSVWYRRIGHGLSIAGAATAVTGLVFASLNQPRRIGNPARRNLIRLSVAPGVVPAAASVSVTADF